MKNLNPIAAVMIAGISFCFLACSKSGENRPAPGTLPVYEVTQSGANDSQVKGLAENFKIPRARLSVRTGMVSFIDTNQYLAIPSQTVTDPASLKQLRASARNEIADAPIRYDAIDFDALNKRSVFDIAAASKSSTSAFASAGFHMESAKPVTGHTVFTATYKKEDGSIESINKQLDTKVNYRFTDKNGYPFIGPGAQVQVSYNATGMVTQLHYAWREVKAGPDVKIINESEAMNRMAKLLPAKAKINMRLVYWCPPFENAMGSVDARSNKVAPPAPTTIIPWYAFTGMIEIKDSATGRISKMITKERLIPATDDPQYIPSAHIKVSGAESAKVDASVEPSGGRPPYRYVWSGSNPTVLASTGTSVSYAPLVRATPSAGSRFAPNETLRSNEIVSVTVIDANGIAVMASTMLPVQAQPIIPDTHGPLSHGVASYGCESPGEPEMWTQERVGWQQGMSHPGAGTEKFCWLGNSSWPGDYIKPSPAGSLPASPWINGDADYANWGANTANLVLINGDGWPDGFTAMYPGAPQSAYNSSVYLLVPGNAGGTVQMPVPSNPTYYHVNYNGSWGPVGPNDRLYWLAGLLCECLDSTDGAGLNTGQRWGPAFGGLHIYTGFASNAAYSAGAFPKAFAENFLGVYGATQTILNAWFNASTSTSEGTAAAMGPITTGGVSDVNDYYIGKGSRGPTITGSAITGWWYMHQ